MRGAVLRVMALPMLYGWSCSSSYTMGMRLRKITSRSKEASFSFTTALGPGQTGELDIYVAWKPELEI